MARLAVLHTPGGASAPASDMAAGACRASRDRQPEAAGRRTPPSRTGRGRDRRRGDRPELQGRAQRARHVPGRPGAARRRMRRPRRRRRRGRHACARRRRGHGGGWRQLRVARHGAGRPRAAAAGRDERGGGGGLPDRVSDRRVLPRPPRRPARGRARADPRRGRRRRHGGGAARAARRRRVFATAGSPAKRELLRTLGVAHVFDSRSAGVRRRDPRAHRRRAASTWCSTRWPAS